MHKKGSIGLAISTIVIVIISLVVLTSGILFVKNLIGGAEDLKTDLDSRTQAELQRLLIDQGMKSALPLHRAELEGGDSHVFGLGIFNVDQGQYGSSFKIAVDLSKVTFDNVDITEEVSLAYVESWLLYEEGDISIAESEQESFPILISVPNDATKGTYIFDVRVRFTDSPIDPPGLYDNVKKFYVTVN